MASLRIVADHERFGHQRHALDFTVALQVVHVAHSTPVKFWLIWDQQKVGHDTSCVKNKALFERTVDESDKSMRDNWVPGKLDGVGAVAATALIGFVMFAMPPMKQASSTISWSITRSKKLPECKNGQLRWAVFIA